MDGLPEPLREVLKSFCHVEWYEAADLARLVNSGEAQFDVGALKSQMEAKLADPSGLALPINKLTLNEFESDAEARAWLLEIYQAVFGGSINRHAGMNKYPNITYMLKTIFNCEDGLSEDVAIRLYQRTAQSGPGVDAFKRELETAFADESLSWRQVLLNEEYEVFDASNEGEAREYARRILWAPLQRIE